MRSPDYPDRKRNWDYIFFFSEAVETRGLKLMYNLIGEKNLLTISLYERQHKRSHQKVYGGKNLETLKDQRVNLAAIMEVACKQSF